MIQENIFFTNLLAMTKKVHGWIAAVLMLAAVASCSDDNEVKSPFDKNNPVLVGAIRWDAWHDRSLEAAGVEPVVAQVERSLWPEKYHFRAPFFADVTSDNKIYVEGYTQEIVDQEIAYAKEAGLDYWAFLLYDDFNGINHGHAMSQALNYYLTSNHKTDINFCAMEAADVLFLNKDKEIERLVNLMKEPSYQMVLGNRPLFYLYGMELCEKNYIQPQGEAWCRGWIDKLREAVKNAGFDDLYLIVMCSDIKDATRYANMLGAEVLSSYSVAGASLGKDGEPYTALMAAAKRRWYEQERAGFQVAPIVSAGWDRRPRAESGLITESDPNSIYYYEHATPEQLAKNVQNAVDFVKARRTTTCPAGAILIYAWNEHDEGGYLCPTLGNGNGIDKSKIEALKMVKK